MSMVRLPPRMARIPRTAQTCANCDAFLPNKAHNPRSGEPRQGWCRAAPPGIVQGMAHAGQLSPQGPQLVPVLQGMWPPTNADQWCRAWDEAEDDAAGTS